MKSPTGPTERTDPEKNWVSNSSIATYWTGSVGKVPFNFWWKPGSNQWLFLVPVKGGRWHIIPQLAVYTLYTTYILPPGGLYATYHLLREPESTFEANVLKKRILPNFDGLEGASTFTKAVHVGPGSKRIPSFPISHMIRGTFHLSKTLEKPTCGATKFFRQIPRLRSRSFGHNFWTPENLSGPGNPGNPAFVVGNREGIHWLKRGIHGFPTHPGRRSKTGGLKTEVKSCEEGGRRGSAATIKKWRVRFGSVGWLVGWLVGFFGFFSVGEEVFFIRNGSGSYFFWEFFVLFRFFFGWQKSWGRKEVCVFFCWFPVPGWLHDMLPTNSLRANAGVCWSYQVKLSSVRQSTVRMLDVPRVHLVFLEANLKLSRNRQRRPYDLQQNCGFIGLLKMLVQSPFGPNNSWLVFGIV